ncbi:hypothetical protein GE061_019730 [Apolygus lucorum]|uniref:Uncharacterized protein n=1 Tax=Apolygus lucorum TaxID=248454 RepID=A0A8S9X984_APOLU|nr:hypothetical protein GE061_019730 [Apolygus lucorum]
MRAAFILIVTWMTILAVSGRKRFVLFPIGHVPVDPKKAEAFVAALNGLLDAFNHRDTDGYFISLDFLEALFKETNNGVYWPMVSKKIDAGLRERGRSFLIEEILVFKRMIREEEEWVKHNEHVGPIKNPFDYMKRYRHHLLHPDEQLYPGGHGLEREEIPVKIPSKDQPKKGEKVPSSTPLDQPKKGKKEPSSTPLDQPKKGKKEPSSTPLDQPKKGKKEPSSTPLDQPKKGKKEPSSTPLDQPKKETATTVRGPYVL